MKYFMAILFCLIILLVVGCSVTPEEYEAAQKACEPYGGLHLYHNPFVLNNNLVGDAVCANGLTILEHSIK